MTPASTASPTHPGPADRLGLPESGPGSLAPLGARVVALAIDWLCCLVICVGLLRVPYPPVGAQSLLPLGVLLAENVLLVGTLGSTLGHRLLGLRVTRVDGAPLGPAGAGLRSLLLVLVVPPVVWAADGRGFHDRIAGSVLVRR